MDYPIYRCSSHNDCPAHVTIAAELTEAWVWEQVKARLADAEGRASADEQASAPPGSATGRRSGSTGPSVVLFGAPAGLLDEPASVEMLTELRADRDARQEALDRVPLPWGR